MAKSKKATKNDDVTMSLETAKLSGPAENIIRSLVGLSKIERAAAMAMAIFCLQAQDGKEFLDVVNELVPQFEKQVKGEA